MNVILVAPQLHNDLATAITVKWAKKLQKSLNDLDHITLVSFIGKNAIREKIEPVLKNDRKNKGVFIFIDHGETDRLLGADDEPLIDSVNIEFLKNKFIYAVACKSASKLGHDALKKGAAGYIGFTDNFHIIPAAAKLFFECFLSGIMEIVKHKKATLKAREKVENTINLYIDMLNAYEGIHNLTRKLIITALRHNMDCMVCLGDWKWKIE